jgi:hypothetical protein
MSEQHLDDDELRAAYRAWQLSRAASDERPADGALSPDALAALVEGSGDDEARIAALDAALASPASAAELSLLLAARAAADAAVANDAPVVLNLERTSHAPSGANDRAAPRTAHWWRRVLPVAAALTLVVSSSVIWWQGRDAGVTRSGSTLPAVPLIGERDGVLVWQAVPEATSYRVEVLDTDGTSRFSATVPDTVAALPLGADAARWSSWWVRAYTGGREIAASPITVYSR